MPNPGAKRLMEWTITFPTLLLLLLLTAIELSLGGSSPYTRTDETNKKTYINGTVQKHTTNNQNTVNTSTHISKTNTRYKTHVYTHPHFTNTHTL
jgi:hypothetical protein